MPLIDIEIVCRPDEDVGSGLAGEIADRLGQVLQAPPGTTWVKVRTIHHDRYAENGVLPAEGIHPVFMSILKAKLPSPEKMQEEVSRLTEAVAQLCDRPKEDIHIIYLPEGAGRVAFGGRIVSG